MLARSTIGAALLRENQGASGARPTNDRAALLRYAGRDLRVVPATGAYGHALANNYNAIPRPPVIFCRDGEARVVVRRETYDDLTLRDA